MASQGPNSPSAAGTDSSVGTVTWTSTGNIYSSNNSRAIVSYSGPGTSYFLKATGFGFSIPSGATIDGIEVVFEGYSSIGGGSEGFLNITKLIKGGSIVGTDQDSGQRIEGIGDTTVTIGGPSNLWGTTWNDSEINASDFGVAVSITTQYQKSGGGAYCDTITIKVYYTTGGGGGGSTTNAILYIGN